MSNVKANLTLAQVLSIIILQVFWKNRFGCYTINRHRVLMIYSALNYLSIVPSISYPKLRFIYESTSTRLVEGSRKGAGGSNFSGSACPLRKAGFHCLASRKQDLTLRMYYGGRRCSMLKSISKWSCRVYLANLEYRPRTYCENCLRDLNLFIRA